MVRNFVSPDERMRPDPKYRSKLVAKFVNTMMECGKKTTAQQVFYETMDIISKKLKTEEPLKVFEKAVENVKPYIEVRSRRVGGQNLQVPTEVKSKRRQSLAFRWILEAARAQKGKPMADRLAFEFIAASKNEGASITKKDNVHKMAEANKAFAHLAW